MTHRVKAQLAEALGPVNRFYCAKHFSRAFDERNYQDCETLWRYFIDHGGADDFAKRWDEAMGDENRWFCSQFYHHDVRDEEILWDYFLQTWKPPSVAN